MMYVIFLTRIDWKRLYGEQKGYGLMEHFKKEVSNLGVDYVLIDSRTGWSDIAGISAHQIADLVVLVFSLNTILFI